MKVTVVIVKHQEVDIPEEEGNIADVLKATGLSWTNCVVVGSHGNPNVLTPDDEVLKGETIFITLKGH